MTYSSLCHSQHCSMMFLTTVMWSVQSLSLLKLFCSLLRILSGAGPSCLVMILPRILIGNERSVMPLQLLQWERSPFFGILTMFPHLQPSGIVFLSQSRDRGNILKAKIRSDFSNSAFRQSMPGAFPFFSDLIVSLISSVLEDSVLTSRSVSVSGMSGDIMGSGQFRSSSKCSHHHFSCLASVSDN